MAAAWDAPSRRDGGTRPEGQREGGSAGEHSGLVDVSVAEIMSRPVFSVPADLRLGEVLAAMVRTGVRHMGVVDDEHRCLGVVADRAIAAAWAMNPHALSYLPVFRVLDRRPAVVAAGATIGDVAEVMHTDRVDAVAVIDPFGRPVGIVTSSDLIGLLAAQAELDAGATPPEAPASEAS